MQHGTALVFVEVRYRKSSSHGLPQETVDARKQSRIRATAEHYLQHNSRLSARPCRFDIVALMPGMAQSSAGGGSPALDWLQDAFGV
jgi:putative endonuclease